MHRTRNAKIVATLGLASSTPEAIRGLFEIDAARPEPEATIGDAVSGALRSATAILPVTATVTYTTSGAGALREARERPESPILAMTPLIATARRLALVWGVHAVTGPMVEGVPEMIHGACSAALDEGFGSASDLVAISAGLPFGRAGNTNLLHITRLGDGVEAG